VRRFSKIRGISTQLDSENNVLRVKGLPKKTVEKIANALKPTERPYAEVEKDGKWVEVSLQPNRRASTEKNNPSLETAQKIRELIRKHDFGDHVVIKSSSLRNKHEINFIEKIKALRNKSVVEKILVDSNDGEVEEKSIEEYIKEVGDLKKVKKTFQKATDENKGNWELKRLDEMEFITKLNELGVRYSLKRFGKEKNPYKYRIRLLPDRRERVSLANKVFVKTKNAGGFVLKKGGGVLKTGGKIVWNKAAKKYNAAVMWFKR
jgi:hypothetical protein